MHARRHIPTRRANTIVLVAGVLALLVIVATAYVTRTQGGRRTAVAIKNTELRNAKDRQIGETISGIIGGAQFPSPVNFNLVDPAFVADSNIPRLSPLRNPVPFGIDQDNDGPDGIPNSLDDDGRPDAPYNFAPFWVAPYTNWPDAVSYVDTLANNRFTAADVPYGPGNPTPTNPQFQLNEFNPLGNPGFGDCRWLADTEPLRWNTGMPWSIGFKPQDDAYFMWRHLSNIASANNGWRICSDISDVFDLDGDGLGGLVMDMNLPVEQFLLLGPTDGGVGLHRSASGNIDVAALPFPNTADGDPTTPAGSIEHRFYQWFFRYPASYRNPELIPPNFMKLSDLNANNLIDHRSHNPSRPSDEDDSPNPVFAVLGPPDEFNPNTHRYHVSRFMADADGDGFTDSFWYLAPTTVEKGIRQVVAVRIVDNSGLLDINAGSRFVYSDLDIRFPAGSKTIGATPADLALVSDINPSRFSLVADDTWNVGYFDMLHHQETWTPFTIAAPYYGSYQQEWDTGPVAGYPADQGRWVEFRQAIGISNNGLFNQFETQAERLSYWQYSGRRPLAALGGLTPFGMADEMELRLYAGQNYPYVVSRLELAVNAAQSTGNAFLRTHPSRQEASEYFDQLDNRELFFDHRHRMTVYNGSRNDRRPPWIWPDGDGDGFPDFYVRDYDFDGNVDQLDRREFEGMRRKHDLRTPFTELPLVGGRAIELDVDNDGLVENPEAGNYSGLVSSGITHPRVDDDLTDDGIITARDHLFHLRNTIQQSMIYQDTQSSSIVRQAYFGSGTGAVDSTRKLAASLAANVKAFVDEDLDAPLADAVPVAGVGGLGAQTSSSFLGIEPQPFLVEVFFGRMYKGYTVPMSPANTPMLLWANRGSKVIYEIDPGIAVGDPTCIADRNYSEVMAVQIANPFNEPIPLAGYEIELFGQRVLLLDALNGAVTANTVTLTDPMMRPMPTEMSDAINAGYLPPANEKLLDLDSNNIPDARQVPTLILWAVKDDVEGDLVAGKWLNFLDLDHMLDLPLGTAVYRVPSAVWKTGCRGFYDQDGSGSVDCNCNGVLDSDDVDPTDPDGDGNVLDDADGNGVPDECEAEDAVLLYRNGIVIDRMDPPTDRELHEAISDELIKPPTLESLLDGSAVCDPLDVLADPAGSVAPVFPGIVIATPGDTTDYWVEWARATRAWGADFDGDGVYEDRERNPRFVFGNRANVVAADTYTFADNPDSSAEDGTSEWFNHSYQTMKGGSIPVKPTFFNLRGFIEQPTEEDYDVDPNNAVQPIYNSYPDKGWYGQGDEPSDPIKGSSGELLIDQPFPMQMMIKHRDLDQVGELLNVFIYGHELTVNNSTGVVTETARTFSEFMALAPPNLRAGRLEPESALMGHFTRQELDNPQADYLLNPRHALPAVPATVRLLDAFVCDGPGQVRDFNQNGTLGDGADEAIWNTRRYYNANNFSGRLTPGLMNLNTVIPEVMRTLPHFYRAVHRDPSYDQQLNRYTQVPDALVRYRERMGNPLAPGGALNDPFNIGPGYHDRGAYDNGTGNPGFLPGMRADRGLASANELLLVRRPGKGVDQFGNPVKFYDISKLELRYDLNALSTNCGPAQFGDTCSPHFIRNNSAWQIDYGALREEEQFFQELRDQFGPLETPFIAEVRKRVENETISKLRHPLDTAEPRMFSWDTAISTDVNGERVETPGIVDLATGITTFRETVIPDATAADAEEANLLFAGASNLISSRSDVFTVYFKVRSFRQNPTTGVWNAMDPDHIVDDTRYVMMVDRSEVNSPTDKPKILYFERLPN